MDDFMMWLVTQELALLLALVLGVLIIAAAIAAFRWIKRLLGIKSDDGFFIGIGF